METFHYMIDLQDTWIKYSQAQGLCRLWTKNAMTIGAYFFTLQVQNTIASFHIQRRASQNKQVWVSNLMQQSKLNKYGLNSIKNDAFYLPSIINCEWYCKPNMSSMKYYLIVLNLVRNPQALKSIAFLYFNPIFVQLGLFCKFGTLINGGFDFPALDTSNITCFTGQNLKQQNSLRSPSRRGNCCSKIPKKNLCFKEKWFQLLMTMTALVQEI